MRVTIIRETNTVVVDGLGFEIGTVSMLPADVHAIQWDGAAVRGEVEYAFKYCEHCGAGSKKPNAKFTDFAPYQALVDAWSAAKAAADAEAARLAAQIEADRASAEAAGAAKAAEPQA